MPERPLAGTAASPGVAAGAAHVLAAAPAAEPAGDPAHEAARATAALEAAAAELAALAARLDGEEAELVETAVLIAGDSALLNDVLARTATGAAAGAALVDAAEAQAALIAAIDDPTLAARADDVRSVGRRAARLLNPAAERAPEGDVILVAVDLGPADVAELDPRVRGIALARGAVSAHAAIVARSLGLPMVIGLGDDVLAATASIVVDGDAGVVVLDPGPQRVAVARAAAEAHARDHLRWQSDRGRPAQTRDGHRVTVLANAAGAAEVAVGLGYGAEGAGLIRTELAFLDAPAWPTEAEHRRALEPVLGALRGRTATVRVLDFGADKTPPFLAGEPARGIDLLLRHPGALAAQLRAIVDAGRDCRLRVLVPMIETVAELDAVAALLAGAAPLGAMVETPAAAAAADALAARADFLSIGTNDLTAATLGVDRFSAGDACAHHPLVLAAIARTVEAAHAAGKIVEVCGEAASDPVCLPLLVGLGVDELSVGAARVGRVREWVRGLDRGRAATLAREALAAADAASVEALVLQAGEAAAQGLDGRDRVPAVGV